MFPFDPQSQTVAYRCARLQDDLVAASRIFQTTLESFRARDNIRPEHCTYQWQRASRLLIENVNIQLKRVYDSPAQTDGFRILVDRLWPRGVLKEKAQIDLWLRELAPSAALRKWFGHDPAKWEEFKERYFAELDGRGEGVEELAKRTRRSRGTLVYGAKNERHNNAVALREFLKRRVAKDRAKQESGQRPRGE